MRKRDVVLGGELAWEESLVTRSIINAGRRSAEDPFTFTNMLPKPPQNLAVKCAVDGLALGEMNASCAVPQMLELRLRWHALY